MQTQITARHFKASPDLRAHANRRINKLHQYYDGITDVHVILDIDKPALEKKLAEISINVYRQTLTAHDTAATHEEAIDRCIDHLRRQILKYKAKLRSKRP